MDNPAPPDCIPVVIAHRGASGYLPEHSLAAKALAHAMGADFLEQDLVATRDGELIVFHDLWLEDLTDVARHFPDRRRNDGHFYCADLDLREIKQLRLGERRLPGTDLPRFPGRFPVAQRLFTIPTFEEELAFISGLNFSSGRTVGIYPEIKEPGWHRRQGLDIAPAMLAVMERYPALQERSFLQCFDAAELNRLRNEFHCARPLVQLIEAESAPPSAAELETMATYADAIGAPLGMLVTVSEVGQPVQTGLARAARAAGLAVHAYTARQDRLPAGFATMADLVSYLVRDQQVQGLFTDFPDIAVRQLKMAPAV
jgi:glycerophosphoryl diester phosphodiesterase